MDKERLKQLKEELDKQVGDKTQQILLDLINEIKKVNFLTPEEKQQELQELYEKVSMITETKTDALIEAVDDLIKVTKDIKFELPEKLKVEVDNQVTIPEEVKVSNFPDPIEIPDVISMRKPDWWNQINKEDLDDVVTPLQRAVEESSKVNLERYREPANALAVRLVDKKGKTFYDAITAAVSGGFGAGSFPYENASGTAKAALVDAQGHVQVDVLSGGGGGIQYVEGATDATITGTVAMWEDAGDTLRAPSAAKPFPVEIIAGGGTGGTSAADDADFTAGTTPGTPAMGVYESAPSNVTDGDMGIVGITQDRQLKISIETDNVGIGGGTQYTEDAAAAANPVGNALIMVRDDALSGQTSDDGDNIAVRGTNNGELYIKHVDSIAVTGTFWQGTQPISAAALPLPAGAATSANQLADGHNVTVDNISSNEVYVRGSQSAGSPVDGEVVTVQGIASMTPLAVTESSPISGFATSANQLADGHNVTIDNISTNEVFVRGGGTAGSPTDGEVVVIQGIAGADAVTVTESSPISGFATEAKQLAAGHEVSIGAATTAAGDLAKAIDNVVGAADVGVAMLAKHNSNPVHLTTDEGDYDTPTLSDFGALETEPEQHHTFDSLNATAGWSALSNDTLNLATTKKHVIGTDALTFDKVNGAANTVFAGIQKTITTVDIGAPSPHDIISTVSYIPDLTNVDYVFVRVGTDSSNYNEWRLPDSDLTAAVFQILVFNLGDVSNAGITGNGWNPSAISYVTVGVAFDGETNTLAGIIFDELSFHTNQHTSAELNAEVSSSVSSAKIDLQKINGSTTDKGAGNASNGSQRIVIASDDVNALKIANAVEIMDDWDETNRAKVNLIAGQAGITAGAGNLAANTPRVTLADDDPAVVDLAAIEVLLGTIDADTGAIKIAVEKIDGAVVGPGEPTIDSYTQFAINLNAGADQVLVSSAANKQIWVYGVVYTCSVAGTVSFQDEDDTAITGIMDHAANSGLSHPASGNFAMPIWKLGTDKDLEVDVVTAAIDGFLDYAIVSV